MFVNRRSITAEIKGTAKPAKSFAGATDPDIVTLIVTLSATSRLASPLECAHTKNASANPLECAFTKSLDLKSPEINTYKKGGGSPSLPLTNSCLLTAFICGYTFCLCGGVW